VRFVPVPEKLCTGPVCSAAVLFGSFALLDQLVSVFLGEFGSCPSTALFFGRNLAEVRARRVARDDVV